MNRKKKLGWWKHIDFMLIDLLCIQIAYLAAYFFRHQTMRIYRETSLYAHVNILLIIIDICYVLLRGTYKNILKRSFVREIESVLVHNIVMWGACAGGCPVGAISEGDAQYQIDADACIDCGACAGTCPTGAISEA